MQGRTLQRCESVASSGISCGSGFDTPANMLAEGAVLDDMGEVVYCEDQEVAAFPARVLSVTDQKDLETLPDACDKEKFLQCPLYPSKKPLRPVQVGSNCLQFDSQFPCGNLQKVVKVSEFEYRLTLRWDLGTQGHTQWFYFSVRNTHSPQTVKFCIVNLTKPESLYQQGMQPLVLSQRRQVCEDVGWHRAGTEVTYLPNLTPRPDKPGHCYRTLAFQYRFEYEGDTVYFAHCYPYSVEDLRRDLEDLQRRAPANSLRVESLCSTVAGNDCPLVTITSQVSDIPLWETEKKPLFRRLHPAKDPKSPKKTVVLTARVHPGESNSSYLMKGILDLLVSGSRDAAALRQSFLFRIVPMLNPDGVEYGNTRCDLAGIDLNRRWLCPSRIAHPTIFYTKKMMKNCDLEMAMYCDLHGHSVRRNAFMYGCSDLDPKRNMLIKLLPLLLEKENKFFSFADSHFRIEKEKESTARVVCFRELGILSSYTLEASFLCSSAPSESCFSALGRDLCKALLALGSKKQFRSTLAAICSPKAVTEDTDAEPRHFTIESALEEIATQEIPAEVMHTDADFKPEAKAEIPQIPLSLASPIRFKQKPRPMSSVRPRPQVVPQVVPQRPQTTERQVHIEERKDSGGGNGLLQAARIHTLLRYYKEAGGRAESRTATSVRVSQGDSLSNRRFSGLQLQVRCVAARPMSLPRSQRAPRTSRELPSYRFLERSRRSSQLPTRGGLRQ